MIDRERIRQIIDEIIIPHSNGLLGYRIIAGNTKENHSFCTPKACCDPVTNKFVHKLPCVWSPSGYQSDAFIYAMAKSYCLSIPLFANGPGGGNSTMHQSHVDLLHGQTFKKIRGHVNSMLTGRVPPPLFAKPACSDTLKVNSWNLIQ